MSLYWEDDHVTLLLGGTLEVLSGMPAGSVDCIVTSPPYYALRDYGTPGQYGLEATPQEYVANMTAVFREVRRVLADDGTLWLNLGDSYAWSGVPGGGLPDKSLLGVPWRVAIALQDDGWILRNDIIWHKTTAMPERVDDRLSGKHEHLFMLAKQRRYYFDLNAIREKPPHSGSTWDQRKANGAPVRRHGLAGAAAVEKVPSLASNAKGPNPGDVWSIAPRPFPGAHFATFPIDLPLRCIKAGCRPGGTVLDPFSGSATTGAAALKLGRRYIGIDNNAAYHDLAIEQRFAQGVLDFGFDGDAA